MGDKVFCTPGEQQGAIAALDKSNGELMWQAKGSGRHGALFVDHADGPRWADDPGAVAVQGIGGR